MDSTSIQRYREQLRTLLTQVRATVATVTDQALGTADGQGTGELSHVPLHLADLGTEEYLHELNTTLLENEEFLANEIDAALKRVEDGTFGRCEGCGKRIAAERLNALPFTRFCIACATTRDENPRVNLNVGRPRTPEDTLAPEGAMGEDFRDSSPASSASADEQIAAREYAADVHAAGTAGGGTAIGGLAGSNIGRGDPTIADLQDATGSGDFDVMDDRNEDGKVPRSGPSGGAVGGTPAGKRSW